MICPQCGTSLPDDVKFCNKCGNRMESPLQPTIPQPTMQQPPMQPVHPPVSPTVMPVSTEPPMGKLQFLCKRAPTGVKAMSWVSWIACILCVVLLGSSVFMALATPFLELPTITSFENMFDEIADSVDELEITLHDNQVNLDILENNYQSIKKELTDTQQETMEAYIEAISALDHDFSLWDLYRAGKATLAVADSNLHEEIKPEQMDDMQKIIDIVDNVFLVSLVILGILVVLMLLSALFKINTLTVFAAVFTLPIVWVLGGGILAILFFAMVVTAIVMHCMINSNYKKYRKSL